ncbi:unnamed protein product [Mytilus edulis]|uniref:B box-type domain-containing protein n=1 Tax=Mytilus edulis TaxID=6550 RepID=A0A8S3S8M0_MYTED|nr:unnamed protein product [Mytilus edulis]
MAGSKHLKPHHVIDLSSVGSNIPISAKKICNVHPDMLMGYYCTDHVIVCCRACIPKEACIHKEHRKCDNILPLEHASKDVKKSALFTDVMQDIKHLITTLNDLHNNRESNLQSLLKTKSLITKQIREVKSELLTHIDNLEHDLYVTLSCLHQKLEIQINKQKEHISQVLRSLKENENEVDSLKNHGKDVSCAVGVTRDQQGNIYYGRRNSSNIQRMSSDGKNCEDMLNIDNGYPHGMCFGNDFTKLFVINDCLKSVFAYTCRH